MIPHTILHIPHASTHIPEGGEFSLSSEEQKRGLLVMTDRYTDQLFALPEDVAAMAPLESPTRPCHDDALRPIRGPARPTPWRRAPKQNRTVREPVSRRVRPLGPMVCASHHADRRQSAHRQLGPRGRRWVGV